MNFKYKVRWYIDNEYEVWKITEPNSKDMNDEDIEESMYQGSLADCEAWIRLHEGGYM